MVVAAGGQLGPYNILAGIGAGGMGEVYRARDRKLGREVAIKVLPEAFGRDTERLARFEREARILAALNHPNIAAVYGLEHADGVPFLVLELVEGETLRGPLGLEDALPIAKQICEALEAAHEKGIVHRDLKPSNIKLTPDGKVKVLDFGLAKAFGEEAESVDSSQSPTLTAGTGADVILGTAAYMSPEQARGKRVDKRTDIWAFGCVLYELLTGKRAFRGENITDTIADVVTREPDWESLPVKTPESVRRLLRRCLQKNPAERLHDIADARLEINEAPASVPPLASRPRALWWIAAGLFAAFALPLAVIHFREMPPEQQAVRLTLLPPEKTSFREIAVSPDGRRVAFTARDTEGKTQLWVRSLDALFSQPLGGTEGAAYPFWSPDSRWIGFFAGGKLNKIKISGGPPQAIAGAPNPRGGAWNRDGVIVFEPNVRDPLVQVPDSGGEPKPVTELDTSHRETSHRFPQFLPDGRHFLYFLMSGDLQHQGIYAGSLDSKKKTRLLASGLSAAYGTGHVLFIRERALLAQRFDGKRLQLSGEAFLVAEPVGVDYFGRAPVSLSETGVLVYEAGGYSSRRQAWFDRGGKALESVGPPGDYASIELSPEGRRVVTERRDPRTGNMHIWLSDLARGTSTRFISHPAVNAFPVWSPDGRHIAFGSSREGAYNLYQKDVSGAREEELLLRTPANKLPSAWSPDGRWLLYHELDPKTGIDLLVLDLDSRRTAPWLRTDFNECCGQFSPDGQWVAYASDESGRSEIYVRPFSAGAAAGQWPVSTGGGLLPRWRGDGKELFYLRPDRTLMSAEVKTAGRRFEAGIPRILFPTRAAVADFHEVYAVTADGQRFLIITAGEETVSQPATVVMNWTAGLKK